MDSTPVFETEIAGLTPVSPKSFTVNHSKVVIFLSIYVKLQSSKTFYVFAKFQLVMVAQSVEHQVKNSCL